MPYLQESVHTNNYNTEIRLFDSNGQPKQLWQENRIGKALRQAGHEVRITGITGRKTFVQRSHNLVTNVGHALAAGRLGGLGSYGAVSYVALGTGTTAAAATDTALQSEITTLGGSRALATLSQVTTTVTNDTLQLVRSFTFSGALAVTEEGLFDASSAGNLMARQVFAVVNVAATDSLSITHQISL